MTVCVLSSALSLRQLERHIARQNPREMEQKVLQLSSDLNTKQEEVEKLLSKVDDLKVSD